MQQGGRGFPTQAPGQGHGGYHLLLILCWVPVQVQLRGALGREINQAPADNDKQNRF